MVETIVLGIVQGVTEWLPVSSEGLVVLLKLHVFQYGLVLADLIRFALFFHLGTFLAALVYLRKEVKAILSAVVSYSTAHQETKDLLWFLVRASVVSGVIGIFLFLALTQIQETLLNSSRGITLGIGLLLLFTAFFQFQKRAGFKTEKNLTVQNSIVLGAVQGFAILPGLSRSGLTITALLLSGFKEESALRLSFLLSLPAVLGANILFGFGGINFGLEMFVALLFSFLFGLATMKFLFVVAQRLRFAWFVLVFGAVTILAAFV